MVTTNKNPIIDTHTKKGREPNHNTKESHKAQEKRVREEERIREEQ